MRCLYVFHFFGFFLCCLVLCKLLGIVSYYLFYVLCNFFLLFYFALCFYNLCRFVLIRVVLCCIL